MNDTKESIESLEVELASDDTITRAVFRRLHLQEPLTEEFLNQVFKAVQLFDKKQHDYGSNNIAKFGDYGCMVRMSDKIERVANLYKKGRKSRVKESIEDNLRDIANYAIIALLWRDGKWPR
jgi:hypothetical protein